MTLTISKNTIKNNRAARWFEGLSGEARDLLLAADEGRAADAWDLFAALILTPRLLAGSGDVNGDYDDEFSAWRAALPGDALAVLEAFEAGRGSALSLYEYFCPAPE